MDTNTTNEDGSPRWNAGQGQEQERWQGYAPSGTESLLHETLRVLRLWQAEMTRMLAGRQGQRRPSYPEAPQREPYPETTMPNPRHGRRRLYRSRDERMVRGVCGGLADYTGLPVALVRLFFVVLFFTGPWHALIPYVLLAAIVPEEPFAEYV